MKKHLSPVVLLVLLVATIPMISACSISTNQVNATVYGAGSDKMTPASILADQAISQITQSANIKVPKTIEPAKLLVGSDSAYPPLEYLAKVITVENDKESTTIQLVGFEVDLCKAVAKKLGLEATFVAVDWNKVPSALVAGQVDLVASGMVTSPDAAADISSSDTYLGADLAICSAADDQFANEEALKGKVVGFQSDSVAEAAVQAVAGVGEARTYPHVLTAFADLKAGKVDAVVVEQPVAEWILANNDDYATLLKISGSIKTGEGYALWCNKDSQELLVAVNAALAELRQSPAGQPTTTTGSTAGATGTTVAGTATTVSDAGAAKSVYQLLCEKWGLSGN